MSRSGIISWPLAGHWCGAQELCCPGTGAAEGTLMIKSPHLCCEGCAVHAGTSMTPVQAVLVAGAWWRMSSLWGEAADGRDGRRGPWVSARSQGCPSRAGPALPPPCPVKAMPSVPVTGGAGCYPAQGESVPEAALGREHPWLCCSQHHLGDLGLCSVPQLIVLSPALLPLHPPRASVSLGDTGRVVLAQPLTPSWTCRDPAALAGEAFLIIPWGHRDLPPGAACPSPGQTWERGHPVAGTQGRDSLAPPRPPTA